MVHEFTQNPKHVSEEFSVRKSYAKQFFTCNYSHIYTLLTCSSLIFTPLHSRLLFPVFLSAVSVRSPPALKNIHRSPLTFLLVCFLSVPLLHLSFKVFLHLSLRPWCGGSPSSGFSFFFISGLSSTDLPHFLPFLSMCLLPLSSFKTIPASPSISSICSDAFFSSCFSSILLFFSSLSSFICLSSSLVRLQRFLKSWGHQETSSTVHFFLPTIPLSSSYFIQLSSSLVPHSSLLSSSLFSHSWAFHFGLFLWLTPLFLLFVPFPFLLLAPHLQYNVISVFPQCFHCSSLFIACSSLSFDWSSCFSTLLLFTPLHSLDFMWLHFIEPYPSNVYN